MMRFINQGLNTRIGVILFFCCFPGMVSAALGPYYQSAKEIAAIIHHPEVVRQLGPYAITAILKKSDSYVISVDQCHIEVSVVYNVQQEKPIWVGPAAFELKVSKKQCHSNAVLK